MNQTALVVKKTLLESMVVAAIRHYNEYFYRTAANELPLIELENYDNVNISFRHDVNPDHSRFSTVTFSVLDNDWIYHFTQSYNYGVPQSLDIAREGIGANAGDMPEGPDYEEQYIQGLEDAVGHMVDGISCAIAHYTPYGLVREAVEG